MDSQSRIAMESSVLTAQESGRGDPWALQREQALAVRGAGPGDRQKGVHGPRRESGQGVPPLQRHRQHNQRC